MANSRIIRLHVDNAHLFDILTFMKKQTFNLAFEPDPQGGFTVTAPALPGCVTYGATLEEARRMAREAIELYVEDLVADGEKVPESDNTLLGTVEVQVAK